MTLEESYARCQQLARKHYENFPVARLVPREIRPHITAVYAFARTADDIADEGWDQADAPTPSERVARLEAYEEDLVAAAEGRPIRDEYAWIFKALADTIERKGTPLQLYRDLLSAFKQDCVTLRYETHDAVLDYCRRSANPVGRLVLILHAQTKDIFFSWSDAICTGLQLANFWQDVGVDLRKDRRIYIPEEDWKRFGVEETMFEQNTTPPAMRECIRFQVDRTAALFRQGLPLSEHLPFPLSLEIRLTRLGGETILQKIRQLDYDTLARRPRIHTFDKLTLLAQGLFNL